MRKKRKQRVQVTLQQRLLSLLNTCQRCYCFVDASTNVDSVKLVGSAASIFAVGADHMCEPTLKRNSLKIMRLAHLLWLCSYYTRSIGGFEACYSLIHIPASAVKLLVSFRHSSCSTLNCLCNIFITYALSFTFRPFFSLRLLRFLFAFRFITSFVMIVSMSMLKFMHHQVKYVCHSPASVAQAHTLR